MSNEPKYKVGDLAPDGKEIALIYGQTNSVLVFRTTDNAVNYWTDEGFLSDKDQLALKQYDYLISLVYDILPKKKWLYFKDQLASALFNSFSGNTPRKLCQK